MTISPAEKPVSIRRAADEQAGQTLRPKGRTNRTKRLGKPFVRGRLGLLLGRLFLRANDAIVRSGEPRTSYFRRDMTVNHQPQQNRRHWQYAACSVAAVAATAAGTTATAPAAMAKPPVKTAAAPAVDNRPLTDDEKILQVLNRFAFGPRPGDVQKVKAMGLDRYLDEQLHPERVSDTTLDAKLARLPLLDKSGDELADMYRGQQEAFREAQKMRKELLSEQVQKNTAADPSMKDKPAAEGADTAAGKKAILAEIPPADRQKMMQTRQELVQKYLPVRQAEAQLVTAKVMRSVESERQLQEVMVDFWSNHFNIDVRKQACVTLKVADDREVIRKFALGKFRDLLGASAHSPAMLVYLDNFQSTSPNPQLQQRRARFATAAQQQAPKKPRGGINENYAREIMELHTLGVDGGYTQKDVQEVARCLTGWSLSAGDGTQMGRGGFKPGGSFQFYPFLHDNGAKEVLGNTIPAGGGQQDGEQVLDILASNPATMRFISRKLCIRFVSDTPPESLVNKCVATWKRTDGDIREIVRTIATSPEFNSRASFRQKIKSPFEYAVSSVRALGGTYDVFTPEGAERYRGKIQQNAYLNTGLNTLAGQIGTMGEPIFQYQAPTGYPEDSRKWVSSGALISRLNFSLALTNGKLSEIGLPNLEQTLPRSENPSQLVNRLAQQIVQGELSPATRATLLKQVGSTPDAASTAADVTTVSRLAALMLGSPEFQRR